MAARRVVALSAVVVVAVAVASPLFLAGMARADCFDYCFKNCIADDKSMTDYCNYACDKTCEPGAPQRPLLAAADGDMGCQLSCARTSCHRLRPDGKAVEDCFGQCYDGCKTKTKTLPRPLRAGAGVRSALGPVSETGHSPDLYPLFPASEPDAASEKQDAVQPASEPDKDDAHLPSSEPKDYAVRPTLEPDPDDALRPASQPKDDVVRPASEPDPDDALRPASQPEGDAVRQSSEAPDPYGVVHPGPASKLNRYFNEKQDGVLQPATSEPQLLP